MMYSPGDILRVKPLQDVTEGMKSNVNEPYDVIVLTDSALELKTAMYLKSGHIRTFNKLAPEWEFGHRKRFEKVGEDPVALEALLF